MKLGKGIHTPHDGWFADPDVTWFRLQGRWAVELDGQLMAYLDKENHRLWTLNPGLRERIIQQIKAETLVGP